MNAILSYQEPIHVLCETYSVKSLYAFGSILTSKFNSTSDVDLIVEFNSLEVDNYADNYFALKEALQNLFDRQVDLLEKQALHNPLLIEALDAQKILVYGQ
jgi:uncharacterized protein